MLNIVFGIYKMKHAHNYVILACILVQGLKNVNPQLAKSNLNLHSQKFTDAGNVDIGESVSFQDFSLGDKFYHYSHIHLMICGLMIVRKT